MDKWDRANIIAGAVFFLIIVVQPFLPLTGIILFRGMDVILMGFNFGAGYLLYALLKLYWNEYAYKTLGTFEIPAMFGGVALGFLLIFILEIPWTWEAYLVLLMMGVVIAESRYNAMKRLLPFGKW